MNPRNVWLMFPCAIRPPDEDSCATNLAVLAEFSLEMRTGEPSVLEIRGPAARKADAALRGCT